MVSASSLRRSFNGVPAVDGVTFEIPEGKLFALLGPNGAGKTTTVRLLLGLIAPDSGTATVAGLQVGRDSKTNNAVRSVCGLLTETPGFYDRMSAWENLRFFAALYRIPEAGRDARLAQYLHSMDLWTRKDDPVGTFSKGMKQRLAIIRAVFHDPQVIFLDEPTAGLDPEAALMIRDMILRLKGAGRTIVVCTHNLDEAERLADIVGVLRRRLLVCETLASLRAGGGMSVEVELEDDLGVVGSQSLTDKTPFVRRIDRSGRVVTFALESQSDLPRLVQALVEQSVRLYSVRPTVRSLEAVYLQHVGTSGGEA